MVPPVPRTAASGLPAFGGGSSRLAVATFAFARSSIAEIWSMGIPTLYPVSSFRTRISSPENSVWGMTTPSYSRSPETRTRSPSEAFAASSFSLTGSGYSTTAAHRPAGLDPLPRVRRLGKGISIGAHQSHRPEDMLLKRLGLELVLVGLVIALGAVTWDLSYVLGQPAEHHHGDEAAVIAHNTVATIVVIVGVVLAAVGARMLLLGKPASRDAYALFAASSLMLADGILHFYVVSEHLSILSFAVFFVVAGAVQLVLGFGLFRAKPLVYLLSVLLLF